MPPKSSWLFAYVIPALLLFSPLILPMTITIGEAKAISLV